MISGRLSETDFLAAQRLHRRRWSRGATVVLLIVAAVGVIVLLASSLAVALGLTIGLGFVTGSVLMVVAVSGLLGEVVQNRLLLPWQSRRLYRQCAAYRQSFRYSWDEDWLAVVSDSGSARRRWSDYIRFREDDHVFLLYHADNLFEMLPKTWFADAGQIETVRRLAAKAGTSPPVAAPAS